MTDEEKYVAYVSSYTHGDSHGIRIYDVDIQNGRLYEKDRVEISNSSYLAISHNKKYLYSITDFGVESYRILPDGELEMLNLAPIRGMRGCYLSTDYTDSYLFVAGYHDGKLTVLEIREDGSIGKITDEIFHKGLGSVAERNFRPHINCARMTRDNKYLLVADEGMDHINVYGLDHSRGKVKLVDVIRSDIESAPGHIRVSLDGRFIYIVHNWKCYIDVYYYEDRGEEGPYFEKIQRISTLVRNDSGNNAACTLNFSDDYRYLISSNAGDNSVVVYEVNMDSGMLELKFCLPISGEYPKDARFFPDSRHLVSVNNESGTLTFFNVDTEAGTLVMNGPELKVNEPNCIQFYRL